MSAIRKHISNVINSLYFFEKIAEFEKEGIGKKELLRLHGPGQQFGIISAWRSNLPLSQNKNRNSELKRQLDSLGVTSKLVAGVWPGVDAKYDLEAPYFCYDIDFSDLLKLGKQYDQDAVIFKENNGVVVLYDIKTMKARPAKAIDVKTNVPRPKNLEDVFPHTRFRDTTLEYTWGDEVDFDGMNPITIS